MPKTKKEIAIDWGKTVAIVSALVTSIYTGASSAPNSRIDFIVEQLNNHLVPQLQARLNELAAKNTEVCERLAKIETQNVYLEKQLENLRSWMAMKTRSEIPRVAKPETSSDAGDDNMGVIRKAPQQIELPTIGRGSKD